MNPPGPLPPSVPDSTAPATLARVARGHCWATLILVLATIALSMTNAGRMPFIDPDEGRCALIARHMVESGDWLVPYIPLTDTPYFDKPILYFWMLAGAFKLFGTTELAARALSAIAAGLTVGATHRLGLVLFTPRVALWSAILLGTSALTTIGGRFIRMDMWLTAMITWSTYWWARREFDNAGRGAIVCAYVGIAVGCLLKGLIGLLPLVVVGLYLLLRGPGLWASLRRAQLHWGLLIVVVLTAPWFAYMSWRFPGYADDFFLRHHLLRATTQTFGRAANPGYLPAMLLAGMLPWVVLLPGAAIEAWRRRRDAAWRGSHESLWLLLSWVLVAVLPFMFFSTKLPVYVMPAFPAVSLFAGDCLVGLFDAGRRRSANLVFGATLVFMFLSVVAAAIANHITFDAQPWETLARRMAIFAVVAAVAIWLLRRHGLRWAMVVSVAATAAMTIDAACVEGPGLADYFSSRRFAVPIARHSGHAERLLVGPDPRYALFMYLDHIPPVTFLEHRADFDAYEGWDRPLLALLTDQRVLDTARERFGPRLRVLETSHDCWLIALDIAGG